MDALALLCTLHADGPSTLHELRAAGCQNLLDLTQCTSAELAQYLELSIASAERLQREAELLDARLDRLEPEEPRAPSKVDFGFRISKDCSAENPATVEETAEADLDPVPEEPEQVQEEQSPTAAPRTVRPLPPSMVSSRSHRAWFSATRVRKKSLSSARDHTPTEKLVPPAKATTEAVPIEWKAARDAIEKLALARGELGVPLKLAAERKDDVQKSADQKVLLKELVAPVEAVAELAILSAESAAETIRMEPVAVLGSADRPVQRVLTPHRELLDAAARRSALPKPFVHSEASVESVLSAEQSASAPLRESRPGETTLKIGELDGLDEELLDALRSVGICTAEALVEASGLELSRKIAIPFTRLLELQLGAQHLFRRHTLVPRSPATKSSRVARALELPTTGTSRMRRHTDSNSPASAPKVADKNLSGSFEPHPKGSVGGPFA